MSGSIKREIVRWMAGIGLFGIAFWCAIGGYHSENLTRLFLGPIIFLLAFAVMWKPIFGFATRPFTSMIDSIFFPGGKLDKPILNLKLPAYYINEERYTEAIAEYEKILKHHPDAIEAYEKSIWLYHEVFHETEKARQLIREAERRNLVLDDRFLRLALKG
ncbi:MAG: hypothetical protein AAGC68_02420 [Verrucomicrobiota bacterium]